MFVIVSKLQCGTIQDTRVKWCNIQPKLEGGRWTVLSMQCPVLLSWVGLWNYIAYSSQSDFLEPFFRLKQNVLLSRCHMRLHLNFMDSTICRSLIICCDRWMETPWIQNSFFIADGKIHYIGKGCMIEWIITYKKTISEIYIFWFYSMNMSSLKLCCHNAPSRTYYIGTVAVSKKRNQKTEIFLFSPVRTSYER